MTEPSVCSCLCAHWWHGGTELADGAWATTTAARGCPDACVSQSRTGKFSDSAVLCEREHHLALTGTDCSFLIPPN